MIGHWSVLIPNDGHCLRAPSPGAPARQQTGLTTHYTRQTETRTRDNSRRHHPTMLPISWSALCVIWGYFSRCIVNLTDWDPEDLTSFHLFLKLIFPSISGEFPRRPTRAAGSACRTCSPAHTSLWTEEAGAEEKVGIETKLRHASSFFYIIEQRLTVKSSYSFSKS